MEDVAATCHPVSADSRVALRLLGVHTTWTIIR